MKILELVAYMVTAVILTAIFAGAMKTSEKHRQMTNTEKPVSRPAAPPTPPKIEKGET